MDELRRAAYLAAMATDCYVSRYQLPGAAPTTRLAIVRSRGAAVAANAAAPAADLRPDQMPPGQLPRIDSRGAPAAPVSAAPANASSEPVPRFCLVSILAGEWLWLEEIEGAALATEQVQLVQAMALALNRQVPQSAEDARARPGAARPGEARPEVAQFNWPIHTNQQLDLGVEAARTSVAAFIQRKLEGLQCRGMILLGSACEARVPMDQLGPGVVIRTVSTAGMLADPRLKRQAWQDLQSHARRLVAG